MNDQTRNGTGDIINLTLEEFTTALAGDPIVDWVLVPYVDDEVVDSVSDGESIHTAVGNDQAGVVWVTFSNTNEDYSYSPDEARQLACQLATAADKAEERRRVLKVKVQP